jgi:hypothetical protein
MIDVELAMAQLKERLSINERFGLNGLDTNLEAPPPAPDPAPRAPRDEPVETDGTVEARIKAEKLKQAEFLTNRLKLEDAARNGKYMDAQGPPAR